MNKSILGYSIDTLKSKYIKPYGNINIYIYSDVQSILPSKINQINKISRDSFLDIKIILVYNRILGYIKI